MAQGAARPTRASFSRALVIGPTASETSTPLFPSGWTFLEGDHPVARAKSFSAGRAAFEFFGSDPDLPLLALISGGGSALAELPLPPLDEADLTLIGEVLLRSGLAIDEINALRRKVSLIKGGGLLAKRRGALRTLVISDVGSNPAVVASGPTLAPPPDRRPVEELAAAIAPRLPEAVRSRLERALSSLPEPRRFHPPDDFRLLASPADLARECAAALEADRFETAIVESNLDAAANDFANILVRIGETLRRTGGNSAAVVVGEPTLALGPDDPPGGRSAHVALETALSLASSGHAKRDLTLLAFASDGVDGTGGGAGALIGPETFRIIERNRDGVTEALARRSATPWLRQHGALLPAAATGANLRDLFVLAAGA